MSASSGWKDKARSILPWNVYWTLKRMREEWRVWWTGDNLRSLAKIYQTDKGSHHDYMHVYEQWFHPIRQHPVRLLEIGVGGYEKPLLGGDSLRMWKSYFPHGKITGIDLYDKSALQEERIHIYKGDQSDNVFLHEVVNKEGPFDVIIDDGSHIQSHIIASFEALFPTLQPGGIYVIEDTQTSYWPKYEGSTTAMNDVPSAMNYFIQRVHLVNRDEWREDEIKNEITSQDISSISFYHNLIVMVKKG